MIDKTEGEQNKTIGTAVGGTDRFAQVLPKRRRFLTGGLAAAPILASLEVRNALAVDCLTPSRNLSGNLSHTSDIGACAGISAQCYSTQAGQWPGSVPQSTLFSTIYTASGSQGNFTGQTFKQVVDQFASGNAANQLAAYFVAAYLNVRKSLIGTLGGLNDAQKIVMLQSMWNQFVTTGTYSVNATTSWNGAQIQFYLTSNGIVGTTNC